MALVPMFVKIEAAPTFVSHGLLTPNAGVVGPFPKEGEINADNTLSDFGLAHQLWAEDEHGSISYTLFSSGGKRLAHLSCPANQVDQSVHFNGGNNTTVIVTSIETAEDIQTWTLPLLPTYTTFIVKLRITGTFLGRSSLSFNVFSNSIAYAVPVGSGFMEMTSIMQVKDATS